MPDLVIRPAVQNDLEVLWDFLAMAAYESDAELGLNLSVRSENPARRLYERLGFRDIPGSAVTNRAGGVSIGMALRR